MFYGDMIDYVNFRMETADSCLLLIENDRVADALGLCRSLLEHYLLLILRCRGKQYFRLLDKSSLTEGEFKKFLAEEQKKNEQAKEQGKSAWVDVRRFPRYKKVMYVAEGHTFKDEPDFFIPQHYFSFQEFQPEVMRLKHGDYFEYHTPDDPKFAEAMARHQEEATFLYRHYLSYDALLHCLELNGIADRAAVKRIEAHYTYLGTFLHPTHNAARDLHVDSNVHRSDSRVGMHTPCQPTARLMAALYVCYLLMGLIEEIARLHDEAPARYISDASTGPLHTLLKLVPRRFPYFWFIFNEPPLWDKFNYCVNHVSAEELASVGHYSNIPDDKIPFDQHIYAHLKSALGGWSNAKCGTYTSPLRQH